ncbi:ornithine cyclodeaminase family protein [Streptomyces microflavus]|uniref:ornithine cyclodeaminase family protein n=1 Tax=Streptomyces griseus group TaxID=629295 RepID=UPI002254769E|nr:ornithine cyclodeaminase family protein [Streptomyces microflavus]MCX4657121.1 ornithine cyclodeaminase family protein [Streptomyces microflavus]WSA65131.1 ornithine cyclodeaminase family protein [Streptomyces microflavus]WTF40430.1 ornithine cyclodeaminase family protein [Streptomyces cyaneofuscatus]
MTVTLDAAEVFALGPAGAVAAVREALAGGLDPDGDVPRAVVPLAHGQGLLMPSESGGWFGVKIATVAPGNATRGLRRINATYLLHDSATLTPVALLDGVALTTLRTPAVSVAACLDRLRALADGGGGLRLVVFGAGPQGEGHVAAVRAHVPVADVTVVTRRGGHVPGWADRRLTADGGGAADRVRRADVVVTATSAREPVVDGRLVRDGAVVLAVGSHEPDARELDSVLMGRATVLVESRATALREAGDVVMAVHEGSLAPDDLVTLAELTGSRADVPADRPLVVKTCGMGWQDLVVAVAAHRRKEGRPGERS